MPVKDAFAELVRRAPELKQFEDTSRSGARVRLAEIAPIVGPNASGDDQIVRSEIAQFLSFVYLKQLTHGRSIDVKFVEALRPEVQG
jgi:hypothetical protein